LKDDVFLCRIVGSVQSSPEDDRKGVVASNGKGLCI